MYLSSFWIITKTLTVVIRCPSSLPFEFKFQGVMQNSSNRLSNSETYNERLSSCLGTHVKLGLSSGFWDVMFVRSGVTVPLKAILLTETR